MLIVEYSDGVYGCMVGEYSRCIRLIEWVGRSMDIDGLLLVNDTCIRQKTQHGQLMIQKMNKLGITVQWGFELLDQGEWMNGWIQCYFFGQLLWTKKRGYALK